jgi:hypothetical protein
MHRMGLKIEMDALYKFVESNTARERTSIAYTVKYGTHSFSRF